MTKPTSRWGYAPRKPAPLKVPETLKREVESKANVLIESEIKPRHDQTLGREDAHAARLLAVGILGCL